MATTKRQSKNVEVVKKARPGTRLKSFGWPLADRNATKRMMTKNPAQPVAKPKLDIGKASVAGMNKAAVEAGKVKKARNARMALAVGKPGVKRQTVGLDAFMRKMNAVERTRIPKIKKGARPKVSVAQMSKTDRPRKKK